MLIQGFGTALTPMNIGVCMLGAVLGLIVGAMPGIGSLAGVALLLPLTYKFNPATAIIMLGALYYSNMYGGSFSAILLNIPVILLRYAPLWTVTRWQQRERDPDRRF